ncbi:MAG TPA: tetratricopeptide repeat protein [Phycisphaerales bacterium]|nr:tetratricopeptide repeat protein [Phycisphaerales bacterium]
MCDTRTIAIVMACWICFSGAVSAKDNVELGNEAFGLGDYNKAIEYYRLAVDDRPTFAAYVNLGHCYMQLERWDDAASAYESAIQTKQDAVTADIWRSIGRARFEQHRYKEATNAFLKASELAPTDGKDDIWIARCMIELEQWIQAESVLLGQLRREPGDTVTLELLAYVFNQQGNWSGIIGVYRELLKIAPQRTAHRVALAKALMVQGRKQQAIDILEFARRVDVSSGEEIDRLLADLYLAEQMPQEAAGCYARLIAMLDSPSAEDFYRLGLAYFQTGDLTSAEDTFILMRQANPTDFKAELYLGHVVTEAGRLAEAQAHYAAAVEKNPTSAEALVALAGLQIKTNRHADAAENLAKAVALGDNRPQVHYNYILALMKGADGIRVGEALKAALAEHPSDEQLGRLLNRYVEQTVGESGQ